MKISKLIALLSVSVIAAVSLPGCQPNQKTISCKDIFSPELEGLDGSGRILNYTRINSKNEEKIEKILIGNVDTSKLNSSQSNEYYDAKRKADKFANSFSFTIDDYSEKEGNYQNGDEINVTVNYNEEYAELMNINVKDTNFVYKVSNLTEGTKINPFEKLKVTYEGASPNGSVTIDDSECPEFVKNHISFSSSKSRNLKNGESIKISASYSLSRANSEEVIITEKEKDYTVSGLSEYPTSIEGVDMSEIESQMEQMLKEAIELNYPKGSSTYTDDSAQITISSTSYKNVKKYFFNKKLVDEYATPSNSYVCIYEVTITGPATYGNSKLKKGQTGTLKKYYIAQTDDITLDNDKNVLLTENYSDPISGSFSYKKSLDELIENYKSYNDDYTMTEIN